MNEEIFKLNNLCYSNNNENLQRIINKINDTITDLNQNKQIDIIIGRLKDVIMLINKVLIDNKKNFEQIIEEINKMNQNINNQFDELKKIHNNNVTTRIYKEGTDYDGKYIGEMKNGLRDGRGIMIFNFGDKYEGDWKNDKREGRGVFYFKDGSIYEGGYKNNRRDGFGVLYYKNGDRYEGGFKDGLFNGNGIFYYHNGDRKMGDYLNDKPIGKHIVLDPKGIVSKYNYSK